MKAWESGSTLHYFLCLVPSFLACILAFLLWFRNYRTPTPILPPSPRSLPVIGHLHLLGRILHQSLYTLSKLYGPLIWLRLGSVPAIVVSSPELAKEILKIQDVAFASRPRLRSAVHMVFDSTDIVFAPYGPYWRHLRQVCANSIFSNRGLEFSKLIRAEEVIALLQSVYEDSMAGKEIQVLFKVLSASNNTISRVALGKKYSELVSVSEGSSKNIVSVLKEMMELFGVLDVGDFIPWVKWMDLQGNVKRMQVVGENLKSILQGIIDGRRQRSRRESTEPKDLLDVLLAASQESQADRPITDDNIKAVLVDMLTGGTETSSVTVEWALAELLKNPTSMKKLQAELDTVVAGEERFVQESDIEHLPYLIAVVKETMRLHAPVPLLIPRESMKPCQVAGYNIPAKTRVFVNVWAIGRDGGEWERAEEFWPERFLESSVDVRGKHFQLLPFGAGRRGCPGMAIGLLNVQLMVAALIQGFEWSSARVIDTSEDFQFTNRMACPLVAKASPRLSPGCYG